MKLLTLVALLCAGLVALPSAAAAAPVSAVEQATPARFHKARAIIERLIEEEGVPSVSVAVAHNGRILWQQGFGWADRERRVPATAHTPYSLASVTKPITTSALMILREQGKMDLDAPIESYLGNLTLQGYAGDSSGATVRRVISHMAGLPLHYYFYHDSHQPPSPAETVSRYGIIVYPPGSEYFYSNIGYRLLDVGIANASGQSFADFIRREIFLPLGMNRSALGLHPAWAGEAAARYDGQGRRIPFYATDHPGSGDVYASAHDMLRFAMFHLGTPLPDQKPILPRKAVLESWQRMNPPEAIDPYALGWELGSDAGYEWIGHGGTMPGVSNRMRFYPEAGLALVVFANKDHQDLGLVAEKIVASVLPPRTSAQSDETRATLEAVQARSKQLPSFSGTWSGEVITHERKLPLSLTFQPDGDVHVQLGRQLKSLLNGVGSFGGLLMGRFHGTIPTSDARRHRHTLLLLVRPEGDELVGQLVAQPLGDPEIFALASFVRLKQQSAASEPAR